MLTKGPWISHEEIQELDREIEHQKSTAESRTMQQGLEHLLEADQQKLVLGALKKLNVRPFQPNFEDLKQEAQLAYAAAYVRYPKGRPEEDGQRFAVYAYQAIYWRILDVLREEQVQKKYHPLTLTTDEDESHAPTSTSTASDAPTSDSLQSPTWDERIMGDYLFKKIYQACTPAEQRFLVACYVDQLSSAEIAKQAGVTRQCIYKWRRGVGKKALLILEYEQEGGDPRH
jgi:RNA polymerase sigma factor (sigma-70 family)